MRSGCSADIFTPRKIACLLKQMLTLKQIVAPAKNEKCAAILRRRTSCGLTKDLRARALTGEAGVDLGGQAGELNLLVEEERVAAAVCRLDLVAVGVPLLEGGGAGQQVATPSRVVRFMVKTSFSERAVAVRRTIATHRPTAGVFHESAIGAQSVLSRCRCPSGARGRCRGCRASGRRSSSTRRSPSCRRGRS